MIISDSNHDRSVLEIFSDELSKVSNDERIVRLLIFTHRQADPDALCAASGLTLLLSRSLANTIGELRSTIVVPQGASSLGKEVCSRLGIRFQETVDNEAIRESDCIAVVDTGDPHLLEPYLDRIIQSSGRKILIDHHLRNDSEQNWPWFDRLILDSKSTSTCEIIALGFPSFVLSADVADILLTGLMFDSQHLGIATASTLEAALGLVKAGAGVDKAKKTLRYKPDRSELLARIKSAQRLQYEELGGRIILMSEVSSFQASVARMLLDIGGDVGIAYGENDKEARLSIRSTQSFFKETGIDLALEVQKISSSLGITGGGHPTAASLSGKVEPKDLALKMVERLRSSLLRI